MDEAVWEASTPREKVLASALTDWVELGQTHSYVERADPGASLSEIQARTGGRFVAWTTSAEDAVKRIRDEYVDRYDVEDGWPWCCWLDLTVDGDRVARAVEAKLNQVADTSTG